jgi:hypothetical protein
LAAAAALPIKGAALLLLLSAGASSMEPLPLLRTLLLVLLTGMLQLWAASTAFDCRITSWWQLRACASFALPAAHDDTWSSARQHAMIYLKSL